MLNASLPPSLVVGRTLSSYFIGGVQNNQETITYTVYNEQADPETGVLLTDTLQPGVTFQSASQLPDQSGQNLAWSLGTIQGYDRASVTLTVTLGGVIPMQLDTGAQAFATLDAGAVSNSTPAATLQPGNAGDPSLISATPDTDATDMSERRTFPSAIRTSRKKRPSSTTIRNRFSTSWKATSAITRMSVRCVERAARSGATPAMRWTWPASAWR